MEKVYSTRVSKEQADKLTEITTKKELESLHKFILSNPGSLKPKNNMTILDDSGDSDDSDNPDNLTNSDNSDSNKSDSDDSSDSNNSNSKSNGSNKKKVKKNRSKKENKSTKSNRSNKSNSDNPDMISVKDLQIDKLETNLRYVKLDLSNSKIRIMELENELGIKKNKVAKLNNYIKFIKLCVGFLDTNYIWLVDDSISKKIINKKIFTDQNNQLNSSDSETNPINQKITARKIISSVRARLAQIEIYKKVYSNIEDIYKINLLSIKEIEVIISEYKIMKNKIISDFDKITTSLNGIDEPNFDSIIDESERQQVPSNTNSTFNSISYFTRKISSRKESLIKLLDKKIKYYEYLKNIEETASKLFFSILLIILGINLIYLGYIYLKK